MINTQSGAGGFVELTASPEFFTVQPSVSGTVLSLSWDEVPDAIDYSVYCGVDPSTMALIEQVDDTGCAITMASGTNYFQVIARFSSRSSIASVIGSATGGGGGTPLEFSLAWTGPAPSASPFAGTPDWPIAYPVQLPYVPVSGVTLGKFPPASNPCGTMVYQPGIFEVDISSGVPPYSLSLDLAGNGGQYATDGITQVSDTSFQFDLFSTLQQASGIAVPVLVDVSDSAGSHSVVQINLIDVNSSAVFFTSPASGNDWSVHDYLDVTFNVPDQKILQSSGTDFFQASPRPNVYWEEFIGALSADGTGPIPGPEINGNAFYWLPQGKLAVNGDEIDVPGWGPGTILNHALNTSTGDYWIGANGAWAFAGNPATGANPTTNVAPFGGVGAMTLNLLSRQDSGSDSSGGEIVTRVASADFGYAIPNGFVSLQGD